MTISGIIVLLAAQFLALQPADDKTTSTTDSTEHSYATSLQERVQAFKWFSTLGLTDVKDRKLVRVATGHWYQYGKDTPRNTYVLGFLLRDKEGGFTIQTLSLLEKTYVKTPADAPAHEQVSFETKDLATAATAYLKSLRAPKNDENQDERPHSEILLHRRTETFVLAWACWRNGLEDLAAGLFDEAAKMPTGYGYNADKPPTDRLQTLVADDIAHTEMWRTVVAFGESSISRKELLNRFERIVKNYPESKHHEPAKQYAALLRQMIKEDAEHAKNSVKPFDKLNKKEQIAELIFQLRDQNSHQFCQPGSCLILFDELFEEHGKKSPARQLVEFGHDAIPQLIEILEDDRLTRSVEYGRNFFFSHHVLRVGDCAVQILHGITDWEFGDHRVYTGKAAGSRAKAQAWWKEFQAKGEKQMLIEAVQKGDRNGVLLAYRLVEKYPEEALPALAAGARNADDDWHRADLVSRAGNLKGDERIAFLREELHGPFQRSREAAADALLKANDDEGVKAMIREWQDIWRTGGPEAYKKSRGLIGFLVWCGKTEAIDALAADFRKRPLEMRAHLIEALVGKERRPDKDRPREVQDAAERLLVAALDDTEAERGVSMSFGDKDIREPRICDLAAIALADRWDRRDLFKLSGSPRNRDRQILELKNICLKKQGKEPIPLPVPRKVIRAPEKRVGPLLDALRTAKRPEDRRDALKALESFGLPALPAVREALAGFPADHPARTDLANLASRLGFRIADSRFADDSLDPGDKLRKRVGKLRDTTLTEQGFRNLIADLIKDLPTGATGVRLDFERPGDDSGATLVVALINNLTNGQTWHYRQQVFVSNKSVRDSGSSTEKLGYELTKPDDKWAEFAKTLSSVFLSDPEKDISILVECGLGK